MFMTGTDNRKTAITLVLRALKNAGVTAPHIDVQPVIPSISAPDARELLKAMQKADAAGKDYAEDKTVQALVTRKVLSTISLYAVAEEVKVDEQIDILLDARPELHEALQEKFDTAATTLTRHATTLSPQPLIHQAQEAMQTGNGGAASEAYNAQTTLENVREAWSALHALLNGQTLSGDQGLLSVSAPTHHQLNDISLTNYTFWELAHKGVRLTLAADLDDVKERSNNIEIARNAYTMSQRNRTAMSTKDSAALYEAFTTHAESSANRVEASN